MGRPIRETVVLHSETVTKGESLAKEKRRRGRRKPEPPVIRRYKKRPPDVDSKVWKRAMSLAGGDYKRLVVESGGSVLVVNHG